MNQQERIPHTDPNSSACSLLIYHKTLWPIKLKTSGMEHITIKCYVSVSSVKV